MAVQPPLPPEETEKKRKRERGAVQPSKKRKSTAKVAKTTSNLINKWTAVRKDLVCCALSLCLDGEL